MKTRIVMIVTFIAMIAMLIDNVIAQTMPPLPPGFDDSSSDGSTSHSHSMTAGGPSFPGGDDGDDDGGTPEGATPVIQTPGGSLPAPNYAVIDLGCLDIGNSFSKAYGINNKGQIVGTSINGDGNGHAFLYSNGSMQDLGTLGGSSSEALAINSIGQITGDANITGDNTYHAFLYSSGTMNDLGTLASGTYSYSYGYAINDSGLIVGYADTSDYYDHAMMYSNNIMLDLGTFGGNFSYALGISPDGQTVGQSSTVNDTEFDAFWLVGSSMNDIGTLYGSHQSLASAINSSKSIVGYSDTNANGGNTHAFFYTPGSMTDLGSIGNTSSEAYAINSSAQVVGIANNHAFIYTDGAMHDLNSLILGTSGWTLQSATGINDNGQIVGYGVNPNGDTHAFLLNPLPDGAINASSASQASTTSFGALPTKDSGKTSLTVITHGWTPLGIYPNFPPSPDWIDSMSILISNNLVGANQTNWTIFGYKWLTNSWTYFPDSALENAAQQGVYLGNSIGSQGWTEVHLIGHSAGSGLIEAAAERIKILSPSTTIHCTFLDPYIGGNKAGITNYGKAADWSDNYFSRDQDTGKLTEGSLSNAYNIDVTQLDLTDRFKLGFYTSTEDGKVQLSDCYRTESTHSWPILFYSNSIVANSPSLYDGFGYPDSMEGGFFSFAETTYHVGNNPAQILGTPDPVCSQNIIASEFSNLETLFDFRVSEVLQSVTGHIQELGNGLVHLFSGSPVWLAAIATPTNSVNLVSFDALFTSSSGSHGLLSVYWDTNMIGLVDEASVQPGIQHYSLSFPQALANTSHVLGFHLDPFTTTQSSILLTNVSISHEGVTQPFSLSTTAESTNGLIVFQLTGQLGFEYTIQASTNLTSDWTPIAVLANTNGVVKFVDPDSTNYPARFYRAMSN